MPEISRYNEISNVMDEKKQKQKKKRKKKRKEKAETWTHNAFHRNFNDSSDECCNLNLNGQYIRYRSSNTSNSRSDVSQLMRRNAARKKRPIDINCKQRPIHHVKSIQRIVRSNIESGKRLSQLYQIIADLHIAFGVHVTIIHVIRCHRRPAIFA